MAAFVGPAALSAFASMGTIGAAGLAAVATGAATNATTSFINNGGNLGAVFQDVTSSDALKGYVISGVTAGVTAGFFKDILKTTTNPLTGKVTVDLSSLEGIGRFGVNQVLQGGTSALLGKALGQEGSVSDVLKTALFNTLAAASFNAVGDYTKGVFEDGSATKVVIHAMVGGLLSEVTGGDFATGALAAGANEALIVDLNKLVGGNPDLLSMASQIVGVLAASTQGGDADALQSGAWVAENATKYNFDMHLPPGLTEYAQAASSLAEYMQSQGASPEDIAQVQRALVEGQGFDGVQPANEFVKAWGQFVAGELTGLGLAAILGKAGSWFAKSFEGVIDGAIGIQKVPGFGEVDDFFASQSANLNKKLGTKIGEGRLPYETSRAGVEQAKATVKETLENVTSVSPLIPSSTVRGNYDLIHVYSSKTNSTVSLRVLPDGKYEFDTLIPEKSSKF
jgi:filamentous hemagglutinin